MMLVGLRGRAANPAYNTTDSVLAMGQLVGHPSGNTPFPARARVLHGCGEHQKQAA